MASQKPGCPIRVFFTVESSSTTHENGVWLVEPNNYVRASVN